MGGQETCQTWEHSAVYQPDSAALHGCACAGRLNVLANVVRKPLRQIFSEFAGAGPDGESKEYFGTGDVKYHLGTSYDRPTASGKRVHLSLLANPSHLEVSPGAPDVHSQESLPATIQ